MSHDVRWLWLLHAVHHSDEDVDVSTNLRAHPLHVIATTATDRRRPGGMRAAFFSLN